MKYRPDIDGMRALAVLAVLFFHADLGCSGGYVGVDVFFVVSGYLIGRIVADEVDSGKFSYRNFWERRLRRLLPALAAVLLFSTVAGWFLLFPQDYQELGATLVAQPLLASNFVFWQTVQSGYFADAPEIRPTLHTWSLAVEEQFYLLYPALMLLAHRIGGPKRAFQALLLLAFISLGLSLALTSGHANFAYFLLPTRAFEILLGALAWKVPIPKPGWLREGLAWLGLASILVAILGYREDSVFPGYLALLPCLGTVLLLVTGRLQPTAVSRGFSHPLWVWLGLQSYSLYLWHWPIIAYWKYTVMPWQLEHRLGLVALSVFVAQVSLRGIERPFRQRRWLGSTSGIFGAAAVFSVLCYVVGYGIWFSEGAPDRWSRLSQSLVTVEEGRFYGGVSNQELEQGRLINFGVQDQNAPTVFVWGDSHAMALLDGLDPLCRELKLRGHAAVRDARPPFPYPFPSRKTTEEQSQRCRLVRKILQANPPDVLLIACRWDVFRPEIYQEELNALVEFLKKEGIDTWFVLQVPRYREDVPRTVAFYNHWGRDLEQIGVAKAKHQQDSLPFIQSLDAAGFPQDRRLDPASRLLNRSNLYGAVQGKVCLYRDSNHLSVAGSRWVAPCFRDLLSSIARHSN